MVAIPTRIWPKPLVHIHESESRGREGTVYRVLAWHGVYECDCPARVECKHIKQQRKADEADRAYLEEIRAMNTINERGLVPHQQAPDVYRAPQLGSALITQDQFKIMWGIAQTVYKGGAGMVPDSIGSPEAAMAVMLAGHELGFPPFSALRLIFPVNGKMQIMTEGFVALVRQRDPSARFLYHHISDQGADVELIRNGVSQIRVQYTEPERVRAHQGQSKRSASGQQEWIAVKVNGVIQKHPPQLNGKPHPKAGKTVWEKNPDYNASAGDAVWTDDDDSPWTKHRADMFAWAATKRCVRFGAPDLVNLAPRDMVVLEDEIETSELSRAVYGGSVALDAFDDDEEGVQRASTPPDEQPEPADVEHEDPQQAPVSASAGTPVAPGATTPAAPSVDDDEPGVTEVPMDLATTRQTLEALLTACKGDWGERDFTDLQAEMGQFNPDGKGIFNPRSVPESKAAPALAFLKQKRGDPMP